jgi:hypothetical protein
MNKLNYLKAMAVLLTVLIIPINTLAAVAAEKLCALGETCQVSCAYTLIVPITNDPNRSYKCHVELGNRYLVTYFIMDDAAWWWDRQSVTSLSHPSNTAADVIFYDKLKSLTGTIKIAPVCFTRYRALSALGSETVICTKINVA